MPGFGTNNLLLDLHGLLMILVLICGAFAFGAIYFPKTIGAQHLFRLKATGIVLFILIVGLMITGIIPDMSFGSGATFTYNTTNSFGAFAAKVTDDSLGNFTGPLLFDMMEHVTLIVPGLAAVIGFLIWHYGQRLATDQKARGSVISLMILTGIWMLALGMIGVYITKILTFPV